MATKYFRGGAVAVAQVTTVQITGYDAATTYAVTIGGVSISVAGTTDANGTAAALQALLDASTHPYFSTITWTVATDTITATADTAGVPFTFTASAASGTGTIGSPTTTTSSAGPNHWDTAANWSDGAVPVSTDTVVIDGATNIFWGLDQNAVDLTKLEVRKSYSGKIGLPWDRFTTNGANAGTVNTSYVEYRQTYLKIQATDVVIGSRTGPESVNLTQSGRIKIDCHTKAVAIEVLDCAERASEPGKPVVNLLTNSTSATLTVRKAPGGVGLASDTPNETSTINTISVSQAPDSTKLFVGDVTINTSYEQSGGTNLIKPAATLTTCNAYGGTLTVEGTSLITTLNVNGGYVYSNNATTSGDSITTANVNAGTLDGYGSSESRTWGTVTIRQGAIAKYNRDNVTVTTLQIEDNVDAQIAVT